jgi:hypothetical protein
MMLIVKTDPFILENMDHKRLLKTIKRNFIIYHIPSALLNKYITITKTITFGRKEGKSGQF